jgi:cytochrome c553
MRVPTDKRWISTAKWRVATAILVVSAAVALTGQYRGSALWWDPANGDAMQVVTTYEDRSGELMVYNADGPIPTLRNPFFQNIGPNGRACVTCHQPSNAMSLSTDRIHERWSETGGDDPVFAAVDGSNCPSLPQDKKSSHSLLLSRGVFRIPLPWPAENVKPDFSIEVVSDPTGCNTDPVYGLKSAHPTVSVFRRPRMVANLKYVLGQEDAFGIEKPATGSLAADGRDASLIMQAQEAMHAHEQTKGSLTTAQVAEILAFENQIYVAQNRDSRAGDLAEVDGPKALGAWNLGRGKAMSDAPQGPVFSEISDWKTSLRKNEQSEFRASVARGGEIFETRKFAIKDTAGMKAGVGTCASCHTAPMTGSNLKQVAMDVGTTVAPHEDEAADLPLFKVTCDKNATPHPYLGRVIFTTDPGRALITGKCADAGSIVMQQFRGLSARAPYFSNGSAASLGDVVDFYDRRFAMQLSAQDRKDLVNFLGVL